MKKFIITANFIAIMALVPAVVIGYLHEDTAAADNTPVTELVKDVSNGQDDGTTFNLVKSF